MVVVHREWFLRKDKGSDFMEKGKSIVSKFKNKLYFCPIIVK
jgi:hypothetical protein